MPYYVSLSAGKTATDLWATHLKVENRPEGTKLGNIAQETTQGAGVANRT
jgi:hypothetical protein